MSSERFVMGVGFCSVLRETPAGMRRKRAYATKSEAKKALKKTNAKRNGHEREAGVYECGVCGWWHTTKRRGGLVAGASERVDNAGGSRDDSAGAVSGRAERRARWNTALTDLLCLMAEGRARMVREPGLAWERSALL